MIKVLNIKDILKTVCLFLVIAIILVLATNSLLDLKKNKDSSENKISILESINENVLINTMNFEITASGVISKNNINSEDKDEEYIIKNDKSILKGILGFELSAIDENKHEKRKTEDSNEQQEEIVPNQEEEIQQENSSEKANEINLAQTNVSTQVIQDNNLKETYNKTFGQIKINNQTSFELTDQIINQDFELSNRKDIVIFHTHTCESYTPSEKYDYTMTGNYRTTDLNYSVARVGDELEKYLTEYGYNVIHDKTYHDYPAYTGSYTRSLKTVQNILSSTNSDIVIDLHRDAVGSKSDYAPTVKIGDDHCAQVMFVMGTNGGGLMHDNWRQNLRFALEIQSKADELYPGLFRPIILRNSRYNQNVAKAACIIEVGATGNTLDQCLNSMKYLSKVISEVVK